MSVTSLGFELEWFDPIAKLVQKLFLKMNMGDSTIEILHEHKRKPFLNRIYYPQLSLNELYLGNSVTILNRVLTIKAYANSITKGYMSEREVHYLCAINARGIQEAGNVINLTKIYNLQIGRVKTCGSGIIGSFSVNDGDVLIELVGFSRADSPAVISAIEGVSSYVSAEIIEAESIEDVIGSCRSVNVSFPCSIGLIKPHIIKERRVGELLNYVVSSGFVVKGLTSLYFNTDMTEEFFGVYRGVFPKYSNMVSHITSGFCIAVLVEGSNDSFTVVEDFRTLCGPTEPEIGRILRPKSVRAKFGKNFVENAIHCTDLPEDAEMEAKFLFETVANF